MRFLLALAAIALLVAGCGEAVDVGQESPPSPSPTPSATPSWPATGCKEHSAGTIDYVSDANGAATREEAAAPYMEEGDSLVREGPQPPHSRRGWVVVTSDNEIRAALTIFKGENGYLVDTIEKCAG
jgi:hypothetical protein